MTTFGKVPFVVFSFMGLTLRDIFKRYTVQIPVEGVPEGIAKGDEVRLDLFNGCEVRVTSTSWCSTGCRWIIHCEFADKKQGKKILRELIGTKDLSTIGPGETSLAAEYTLPPQEWRVKKATAAA